MSIKLKVSYQDQEELHDLLQKLGPAVLSCKVAKDQKGGFKRAYIRLKVKGKG